IVERDKLNQVMGELKLSHSKFIDPRTAQQLGKGLAAQLIMTGGYAIAGDTMRIDVRIVEVATGKVLASDKVEGKRDDFFALEKDLVDLLIKTVDVKLSTTERSKLRSNATQSFDAWKKYSAGLDAKDRGDPDEARKQFQAALDADPGYRAAKTATERLQIIFQRDDAAKAAEVDRQWKALDPKAPEFAKQVDTLLASLQSSETDELRRKVQLLTFLVKRDLTPQLYPGFSRVAIELMSLVWRFDQMPDAKLVLPPVCEYLLSRYPDDQSSKMQCKLLIKNLPLYDQIPADQRKASWASRWDHAQLDWELALKAELPDILALFKLCAAKLKH
ncbi:MAG TPA: FlgO family outer membrane protein, partial [Kofleriaceae bacterium]